MLENKCFPRLFPKTLAALPTDVEFSPFRPALQERFLARFHREVEALLAFQPGQRDHIYEAEVQWARDQQGNPRQQALYQALWLLLRDLERVQWAFRWNELTATFEIAPPPSEDRPQSYADIQEHKQLRRDMMAHERQSRLVQAHDFIMRMEQPARSKPITALVADGKVLAAELRAVRAIQDEGERHRALGQTVQPYLQLVEEGVRCPHTGQLLQEIWRYFRLTWASPPYNTPGRSMFYLVRDAARPYHPVMGIASLENAPIFIRVRDDLLGWSVEAFETRLSKALFNAVSLNETLALIQAAFASLLDNIDRAVSNINLDDLCSPEDIQHPTAQLVRRLSDLASEASMAREQALRDWTLYQKQGGERELLRSPYGNISTEAQTLLFKKKRAGELARLLSARLTLTQVLHAGSLDKTWQRWIKTERGRSTVRVGLLAMKSRHVGTSILELNVCGAIPPYNHLLGGKLVALLMCSPQVAADYRRRYGRAPSEIASQLKGEQVIRPAELVYIGTTSLYTAGASQYNRLRLPAGLMRPDAPQVRFAYLGDTEGYGTSHISDATTEALEQAASEDFVQVNHIMGEGVSPKMRILRWGLDTLFKEGQRHLSELMAMHQMKRRVYGVRLAENTEAYLQGLAEAPRYVWDETADSTTITARISDFWRTRWLDMRLHHEPALEAMELFQWATLCLSVELAHQPTMDWAYSIMKGPRQPAGGTRVAKVVVNYDLPPLTDDERQRQLVRDLYRGASGFADDTPIHDLRRLHATSDLDQAIRRHIEARRNVILTGNPGDGKTHLLRILSDEIRALGAVVEQDASAVPNDQIVANWQAALAQDRPYFLAINESVLFNLAKTYPNFASLQMARQQVIEAISYDGLHDLPINDVVVFDLSHRNTLGEGIVQGVLQKLTMPSMVSRCSVCPARGCDLMRNRELLSEPEQRVRQRVQLIFDRITRRGIHVTMRDLQAFVSYILFADRDCAALLQHSDEASLALPQLPYRGVGPLFGAMRTVFDPVDVSHPIYDDQLVNNLFRREDWLTTDAADGGSLEPLAVERFEQRKRAFYFYHRLGDALLSQAGDDEQAFADFLADSSERRAVRNIVQKLRMFFGRASDGDHLPVWQSHRYDQSAQRMIYAVQHRDYRDFELVRPHLANHMAEAFELADDHRLLRLRSNHRAQLRIDWGLFRLLHQAEQGLPALLLQPDLTRRIWQFLEQLPDRTTTPDRDVTVHILDTVSGEQLRVAVDTEDKGYITITHKER